MANLPESPEFTEGVYQLEELDPVHAGPDGIDNLQAKQLANRTAYLKQEVDRLTLLLGELTIADVDNLAHELGKIAMPVGSLLLVDSDVVPPGYLKRNGGEYSRAVYANLWNHGNTPSTLVSQAVKDANPKEYSGFYGDGDGVSTFTVPDWRGISVRFWDDQRGIDLGRAIGSFQDFAIENITGEIEFRGTESTHELIDRVEQAFENLGSAGRTASQEIATQSNTSRNEIVRFDASRVVKTANETRAASIAAMALVKY